ncbi:MAG: hypothetical protein IAE95_13760 [Chitinophagaceae bacterium]|nr:hypothetical protein [Chitinophagaceae bacterium]
MRKVNIMYNNTPSPEINPRPSQPEIKPIHPQEPGQPQPRPEVKPDRDPATRPLPQEVPPGKKG